MYLILYLFLQTLKMTTRSV